MMAVAPTMTGSPAAGAGVPGAAVVGCAVGAAGALEQAASNDADAAESPTSSVLRRVMRIMAVTPRRGGRLPPLMRVWPRRCSARHAASLLPCRIHNRCWQSRDLRRPHQQNAPGVGRRGPDARRNWYTYRSRLVA